MKGRARGAALLLAMMVVALVVTTAAGMVWLQSRAVTIEAASRARVQGGWMLTGAVDWARVILRADGRSSGRLNVDALDEPWATPLAEARLSSFLAADQNNNTEAGPEAFISGRIVDAQSRFNLRNLMVDGKPPDEAQVKALKQLAQTAGAPTDTADRIAAGLMQASAPAASAVPTAPLRPARLADLAWFGIDATTIERLAPWVDLLPEASTVNINTASREVLMAAIADLDPGTAEQIVQRRQRDPFTNVDQLQQLLGKPPGGRVSVSSSWFEVTARLRLDDRVIEERTLVKRDGQNVVSVKRRERVSFTEAAR